MEAAKIRTVTFGHLVEMATLTDRQLRFLPSFLDAAALRVFEHRQGLRVRAGLSEQQQRRVWNPRGGIPAAGF